MYLQHPIVYFLVPSPGGRSLQVRAVDVGTQTELHVAYAEATYMLRSPGDSFKRSMPINMRRGTVYVLYRE